MGPVPGTKVLEEKLKWFDAGSSQLGDSSEPDSSTETSGMSSANREDVRRRRKAGKKQGSRMWDLANKTIEDIAAKSQAKAAAEEGVEV